MKKGDKVRITAEYRRGQVGLLSKRYRPEDDEEPLDADWLVEIGPVQVTYREDELELVGDDVPFLFKQWGAWRPLDPGEKPAGESWFVDSKGRIKELCEAVDASSGDTLMVKLGKKRSGRLLDGETWDQFPRRAL